MVTEAWPRTCLRAGQSSVTITLVLPALSGLKYSAQVRVAPAGIRLKQPKVIDVRRIWHIFGVISKIVKETVDWVDFYKHILHESKMKMRPAHAYFICSPVIFSLGHHESGPFHANVDALQAESERVCKFDSCNHLFTHSGPAGQLTYTKDTHR